MAPGAGAIECGTLAFTTVEDDPDIAPVLKVTTQLFVPVQTGAGHDKDEQYQSVPSAGAERALVGDTTELLVSGGKLYLAAILDLFSRFNADSRP